MIPIYQYLDCIDPILICETRRRPFLLDATLIMTECPCQPSKKKKEIDPILTHGLEPFLQVLSLHLFPGPREVDRCHGVFLVLVLLTVVGVCRFVVPRSAHTPLLPTQIWPLTPKTDRATWAFLKGNQYAA